MTNRTLTVIIHTTSLCNLNCDYCFCRVYNGPQKLMSYGTFSLCLSKIDSFLDPNVDIVILFHGGEPLLLGTEFYERAFQFLKLNVHRKYHVGIQTNLTLLNEHFAELFKEHNCQIGTSVDGPSISHDYHRKKPNGSGSHENVSNNLRLLQKMGIKYGIVSVITDQNVKSPEAFYLFLTEHPDSSFTLSPMFLIKPHGVLAIDPIAYGHFLCQLYDRWLLDQHPPHVSLFEDIIKSFLLDNYNCPCTFHTDCSEVFITIDGEGFVYNCCHFVGNQALCYGNLLHTPFADILKSSARTSISQRTLRIADQCQECEFYKICFGGCMAHTFSDINSRDYFCHSYKMIFKHIKNSLQDLPNTVANTA